MVRWKKSRRMICRRSQNEYDDQNEDSDISSENDDDPDEEVTNPGLVPDGEHEDNYRDPLIRLAYVPLVLVCILYSPLILGFGCLIENSVFTKNENYKKLEEAKSSAGLLNPPMTTILDDRTNYRSQRIFLKTCNYHLSWSTLVNIIVEVVTLLYSFLLLTVDRFYMYPLAQISLYYIIRCNHVYSENYSRFFRPADILGGLTLEVVLDIADYLRRGSKGSHHFIFKQTRLEFLMIPLFFAILKFFTCMNHSHVYKSERLMRKQIRERYIRNGSIRRYSDTSPDP